MATNIAATIQGGTQGLNRQGAMLGEQVNRSRQTDLAENAQRMKHQAVVDQKVDVMLTVCLLWQGRMKRLYPGLRVQWINCKVSQRQKGNNGRGMPWTQTLPAVSPLRKL